MTDPLGSSKRELVVDDTDKMMVYVDGGELVVQMRRNIPSQESLKEASVKVGMNLDLVQTFELLEMVLRALKTMLMRGETILPETISAVIDDVMQQQNVSQLEQHVAMPELKLLGKVEHDEVLRRIARREGDTILNFRVFDNTNGGARTSGRPKSICTIISPASCIAVSGRDERGNSKLKFMDDPAVSVEGRLPRRERTLILKNNVCVRLMGRV